MGAQGSELFYAFAAKGVFSFEAFVNFGLCAQTNKDFLESGQL